MQLTIQYRDDALLAVNKPAGLLVHRGWAKDDLVLTDLVRDLLNVGTVHPLHRLDRQTSGLVLFALQPDTASRMQKAFESGTVKKTYLALVRGTAPTTGIVDNPVPRKEKGERVPAQTQFQRIATAQTEPRHVSLVRAMPQTGRLHQIRRHMKHINHPLIGDANYGKGDLNRAFRKRYGLHRMALHAVSLSFPHPTDQRTVSIEAPLPEDLHIPFTKMNLDGDWEHYTGR